MHPPESIDSYYISLVRETEMCLETCGAEQTIAALITLLAGVLRATTPGRKSSPAADQAFEHTITSRLVQVVREVNPPPHQIN